MGHEAQLERQNAKLKEAREKLQALLEKYTNLYDFAPVGYLTLNQAGVIQEANRAGASLLGVVRSALVNQPFGGFVVPEDRAAFGVFLHQVFAQGGREFCEVTLLKEGKLRVTVRIEAVATASRRECRAVLEDITAHKRAEADRLILNKLESTGILAGGIAHDFNNLLMVILLNVEQAQTLVPPGEELAGLLEQAKQAALTSRSLTQQLLTFASGGTARPKVALLSDLIRDSARPALSGSRVRCEFDLPADLWLAEVDEGQFGQVIRNLVLNAREAMPSGGVVSVRAENQVVGAHEIPSLPPGEYVRVSITDQGNGITQELLPKIFDPYFSTKQQWDQRGMGLGLTICHSIVQKHGGAITVESEPGKGSTFRVYLPACRTLPLQVPVAPPATAPQPAHILVMDDDEGLRKLVGQSLVRMGHEVELAEDGQRAIELYRQAKHQGRPFDVVLLDLTVRGGLGGQETIQELSQLDPTVTAIAMSGYVHDSFDLATARPGFKGTLAKPFSVGRLQEILAQVLAESPGGKATG